MEKQNNEQTMTFAQKLLFCENYIAKNEKGKELARELAKEFELNDPKAGQYALTNWLDDYEKNKYVNFETNPIEVNYQGLGEKEAKNLVKIYIMDKDYNLSNLDKDITKDIEEIQERNNHITKWRLNETK